MCIIVLISVADPDPGSGAFLIPGSGMGRKSASGSGMKNPDHIFKSLETSVADPGSEMEKRRIQDKHHRSATMVLIHNRKTGPTM